MRQLVLQIPSFWRGWAIGIVLVVGLGRGRVDAQVMYLDMTGQRLSLPSRVLYVEQVLDGREGETNAPVGLAYQGLGNRPATVLFRRGLGPELTEWLQQQLPARPSDQRLVLCIRQLRVSEVIGNVFEEAKAELVFDVYAHLPDGYHLVRRLNDYRNQTGLDMTATHAPNVAQLVQNCLQLLAPVQWQRAAQQPALALEQLVADQRAASMRPAILRVAVPKRGIYRTWEQFLSNSPDTTVRIAVDTVHQLTPGWEGTTRLQPKVSTGQGNRVAGRDIWGFADGRQAYIRQGAAFRPLMRQGSFYTFVGSAPLDVAAQQRRSTNTLLYGAVGGALTKDKTGQPTVFALDTRTGQTGLFPLPGQTIPMNTAFVYVYRPLGGPPEARRLLLNNQAVGWLRPGDYLEVPCAYVGRAMRLSLDQTDGATLLLVPDASTATYVKLLTNPSYWQWVPPQQGEAEVDALEKVRKP